MFKYALSIEKIKKLDFFSHFCRFDKAIIFFRVGIKKIETFFSTPVLQQLLLIEKYTKTTVHTCPHN